MVSKIHLWKPNLTLKGSESGCKDSNNHCDCELTEFLSTVWTTTNNKQQGRKLPDIKWYDIANHNLQWCSTDGAGQVSILKGWVEFCQHHWQPFVPTVHWALLMQLYLAFFSEDQSFWHNDHGFFHQGHCLDRIFAQFAIVSFCQCFLLHGSMFQHLFPGQSCHRLLNLVAPKAQPVFASGNHLWCIRIWSQMGLPALAAWKAMGVTSDSLFTAKLSAIFLVSPLLKNPQWGRGNHSSKWTEVPQLEAAIAAACKGSWKWLQPHNLAKRCVVKIWEGFFHGKSTICWGSWRF